MFQETGKRLFKELTDQGGCSTREVVLRMFPSADVDSKGEYGDSDPRASTI